MPKRPGLRLGDQVEVVHGTGAPLSTTVPWPNAFRRGRVVGLTTGRRGEVLVDIRTPDGRGWQYYRDQVRIIAPADDGAGDGR